MFARDSKSANPEIVQRELLRAGNDLDKVDPCMDIIYNPFQQSRISIYMRL